MKIRKKLGLLAVGMVLLATPAVAAATSAQANTNPIVCNTGSPSKCMNRQGGGIQDGTHIVTYNQDFDNNEDIGIPQVNNFVCGQYSTVHNGENGCVGPFTNGSGLNARYDGHVLYEFQRRGTGFCVIPNSSQNAAVLGGCTDNGYVYVAGGPGYYINVFASNTAYSQGFGANNPVFLEGFSSNSQQLEYGFAGTAGIDQWTVVTCTANCG